MEEGEAAEDFFEGKKAGEVAGDDVGPAIEEKGDKVSNKEEDGG